MDLKLPSSVLDKYLVTKASDKTPVSSEISEIEKNFRKYDTWLAEFG